MAWYDDDTEALLLYYPLLGLALLTILEMGHGKPGFLGSIVWTFGVMFALGWTWLYLRSCLLTFLFWLAAWLAAMLLH